MKKVLVTGNAGFLGHHVVGEFVSAGYFVTGVDKRPVRPLWSEPDHFIQADVRDLTYRDVAGHDYIVHLAWRTNIPDCSRHPVVSTDQNIVTTAHLVEVAKEAGVKKFFFPSTASLYGTNPTPWREDMRALPIEHYSWQKLSCEFLLEMLRDKLPSVIGRFFQVFGENQREDTALAAFIRLKKAGLPITLTETTAQSSFRSGQRDFVYAGDLASAVRLLLERDAVGIYNVASGVVHTMEEVADAVGGEVRWIPKRPWEVERHHGDISKLRALGWEPRVSVIEWIRKNV